MIPPLFRSVTRYVDVCISPGFHRDAEQLYRARILSGMLQLYLLMLGCMLIYLLVLAPASNQSLVWAGALCTVLAVCYIGILWILRTREAYSLCAIAAIVSSWMAISLGIGLSGGPLRSPAVAALIIPVMIAFCLQGRMGGMLWANVIFIGHWALLAIDQTVYAFPQWLDTDHNVTQHMVTWAIMYVAITGLMLIFDSINFKLKRDRARERERYEFMATHDPLTGLANRMQFDRELTLALARAQRHGNAAAIVCMDLDDFKDVNDTHGHHVGDMVLQDVAKRLQTCLRKTDCIARMGGDEFSIILDGVGNMNEVTAFAEKIIAHVRAPLVRVGPHVRVGVSMGIALYPQHGSSAEQLCRFADKAMYQAKTRGNGWCLYSPSRQPVGMAPESPAAPMGVLATGKL